MEPGTVGDPVGPVSEDGSVGGSANGEEAGGLTPLDDDDQNEAWSAWSKLEVI